MTLAARTGGSTTSPGLQTPDLVAAPFLRPPSGPAPFSTRWVVGDHHSFAPSVMWSLTSTLSVATAVELLFGSAAPSATVTVAQLRRRSRCRCGSLSDGGKLPDRWDSLLFYSLVSDLKLEARSQLGPISFFSYNVWNQPKSPLSSLGPFSEHIADALTESTENKWKREID